MDMGYHGVVNMSEPPPSLRASVDEIVTYILLVVICASTEWIGWPGLAVGGALFIGRLAWRLSRVRMQIGSLQSEMATIKARADLLDAKTDLLAAGFEACFEIMRETALGPQAVSPHVQEAARLLYEVKQGSKPN